MKRMAKRFEDAGYEVVVTREPGGTDLGEKIRHLLKHDEAGANMFSEAELLLFAASRAQLVRELIIPSLKEGKIVLCDRFLDSTTVYQGVARELAEEPVQKINEFAVGDILPDLTVVLDVPAEIGFDRIKKRKESMPDRMEQESIAFYKAVREGYLLLAQSFPERFFVINGDDDADVIEIDLWDALSRRFIS
jgi:dTMP kinase